MDLQRVTQNNVNIITVNEPRIDALIAIAFKDKMREFTGDGPDHVVLNLANVDFVDSSGLGAIVSVKKMLGSDRKFDLASLTPDVKKVFHLTRMDSIFEIHDDVGLFLARATG